MDKKLFSNENLPYIVIGLFTLVIVVLGIALISTGAPEPLTDDQKQKLLVRADSNFAGPKDSEVVLVNFSDFQCSHCKEYAPIEKQLKEEFGEKVKFVYRYYQMNLGNPARFPNGLIAADAAASAHSQDKFWELHDILFAKQIEWQDLSKDKVRSKFIEYAKEAGVTDIEKFTKDMKEQKNRAQIVKDYEDGVKLGVEATPTIFLNGEQVTDRSYEALSTAIKDLLEEQETSE